MRILAAVVTVVVASATARASEFDDYAVHLSSFLGAGKLMARYSIGAPGMLRHRRSPSVVTTGRSDIARELAALFGPEQREQAERTFERLLAAYAMYEADAGMPAGDLAGATAMLVMVSYAAYRGGPVDRLAYRPLADQLRPIVQSRPPVVQANAAARRELYEQLAILAMSVVELRHELDDRAVAARTVRATARQFLAHLFEVDPDRVQVGRTGVRIAPAPKQATPVAPLPPPQKKAKPARGRLARAR